jgi:Carboxypeptidase regulatory-like domain
MSDHRIQAAESQPRQTRRSLALAACCCLVRGGAIGRPVRRQQLQGDFTIESRIPGAVDLAAGAAADRLQDPKMSPGARDLGHRPISRRACLVSLCVLTIVAATAVACDHSPSAPTVPNSPPPGAPSVVRLEIDGPRTLAPGARAQFAAIEHLSDETVLTAATDTRSSTRDLMVLPDGTFRLTGRVTDAADGAPVSGARIDVIASPPSELSTVTDPGGRYSLYGVVGDIQLRVTKDGYPTRSERVVVTDHQQLDLSLTAPSPFPDVTGTYTLTVSAADECQASLPVEARSRTYQAALEQRKNLLTIYLNGAVLLTQWGELGPRPVILAPVERGAINLDLNGCYYYYTCGGTVFEQLAPDRYYRVTGTASLAISPTSLEGNLDGAVHILSGADPLHLTPMASCGSTRHRIRFSR